MPTDSQSHRPPSQADLIAFALYLCGLMNAEGIDLCYQSSPTARVYKVGTVDVMDGCLRLGLYGMAQAVVRPETIKPGTFTCPALSNPEIHPPWLSHGLP